MRGREAACAAVTLLCLLPALWGEAAASSRTGFVSWGLAFASLACAMEDGTGWHALSGVLLALCNWVRLLMVILLPMTLLLILRKKRLRCIAAYLLGAAAVIATIGQATKSLSGHFIYQAQTMGVNMLMGNNDDADGSYDNTVFGEGKIGCHQRGRAGVTYQVRDAFTSVRPLTGSCAIPRFVQLIPRKLFYFLSTDTAARRIWAAATETPQPAICCRSGICCWGGAKRLCLGDAVVIFSQLIYRRCLLFALDIVSAFRRGTGCGSAVLGHFRDGLRHCGADGRRAALPLPYRRFSRWARGLSPRRLGAQPNRIKSLDKKISKSKKKSGRFAGRRLTFAQKMSCMDIFGENPLIFLRRW